MNDKGRSIYRGKAGFAIVAGKDCRMLANYPGRVKRPIKGLGRVFPYEFIIELERSPEDFQQGDDISYIRFLFSRGGFDEHLHGLGCGGR